MGRRSGVLGLAVLAAGFAASAGAQEGGWDGAAELSYVNTSGNTETQTFGAKLEGAYKADPNRYFAKAAATYGETEDETTANRWFAEGRYERSITERFFGFVTANYLRDKFSGYDYRVNVGPGVGYDVLKSDAHQLKILAGVLWSYDNFTTDPPGTDSYASGKLSGDYAWKISDSLKFRQYADYQVSLEDAETYFVNSETSLAAKVAANLALGVSYVVNFQNAPAEGKGKTDRTLMTSLVVTF